MTKEKYTTARVVRLIEEAKARGERNPVTYVAHSSIYSVDEVFKIARVAGYNVMKRSGIWFEGLRDDEE